MSNDKSVTEAELIERAVAPRVTLENLEDNISSVHYINAAVGTAATQHSIYGLKPTKSSVRVVFDLQQPKQELPISLGLLTICVIVLRNGFTVTGESACASPENYQEDIGQRIAFENAKQKIWSLLGYALRDHLTYGGSTYWAQPSERGE